MTKSKRAALGQLFFFVQEVGADDSVRPEKALHPVGRDPCVPPEWTHLTLTRRFRGAQYCITVENPDGAEHGVRELYVDGVRQDGNLIAPAAPGSVVSVRVVLGG